MILWAGVLYLAAACVLGVGFLAVGVRGWRGKLGPDWAKRLFGASLVYLTGLFAALGVSAL